MKRRASIGTATVGQSFATVGIVIFNNRVVAQTPPVPFGFTGVARVHAEALARRLGFDINSAA